MTPASVGVSPTALPVERHHRQRRDLWHVCRLTCHPPSHRRRARRGASRPLGSITPAGRTLEPTTLRRDGFGRWLSAAAADGEASAKLGPAHIFSLSLGALERMESRHSPLLFTTNISDSNASHTESCCWVRHFVYLGLFIPSLVGKIQLNHLCILSRVLCRVQVRHDCRPHGNTTM